MNIYKELSRIAKGISAENVSLSSSDLKRWNKYKEAFPNAHKEDFEKGYRITLELAKIRKRGEHDVLNPSYPELGVISKRLGIDMMNIMRYYKMYHWNK